MFTATLPMATVTGLHPVIPANVIMLFTFMTESIPRSPSEHFTFNTMETNKYFVFLMNVVQ